jgi:hypothetical protein
MLTTEVAAASDFASAVRITREVLIDHGGDDRRTLPLRCLRDPDLTFT